MATTKNGGRANRSNTRKNESVNAAANVVAGVELEKVVNAAAGVAAPAGAGLSDGTLSTTRETPSAAVGGVSSGVSGHNNSADQIACAIAQNESEESQKEERLYNKVVARFLAPEFDKNAFAAGLIASGLDFTEIVAKVNEGRKAWELEHPAPACSVGLVLSACGEYEKEFKQLVGVAPGDVKESEVRVYSRPAGVLVARPLAADSSASAIVRAVLSYRYKVADDLAIKERERARKHGYFMGLDNAARNGIDLGLSNEEILRDFERRLTYARFEMDSETALLKNNFLTIRAKLDNAIADVLRVCPSVALARFDSREFDVFTLPENITKEQKALCGAQFAKVRNYRRQLTAINAKLFGVDVIL